MTLPFFASDDEFELQDALGAGGYVLPPAQKEGDARQAQLVKQDEKGWMALTKGVTNQKFLRVVIDPSVEPTIGLTGIVVWNKEQGGWVFGITKEWRQSFIKRIPTDRTKFPKRIFVPKDDNDHLATAFRSPDPSVSEWAAQLAGKEFDGVGIIPVKMDPSIQAPEGAVLQGKVVPEGQGWVFKLMERGRIHAGDPNSLSIGKDPFPVNNTSADLIYDSAEKTWYAYFISAEKIKKFGEKVPVQLYGKTPALDVYRDRVLRGVVRKDGPNEPWMWSPMSLKNDMAEAWAKKNPDKVREAVPREKKGMPLEGIRQGAVLLSKDGGKWFVRMKALHSYDAGKDVPVVLGASVINPMDGMEGAAEMIGGQWVFMVGNGNSDSVVQDLRKGSAPKTWEVPERDYDPSQEVFDLSSTDEKPRKEPYWTPESPRPKGEDPRDLPPRDPGADVREELVKDVPSEPAPPKMFQPPALPKPGSPEWEEFMKKRKKSSRRVTPQIEDLMISVADLLAQEL